MAKLLFERDKTVDNFSTERIDAIENQLLGGYTAEGEYHVPSEIVDELIKMEKIKKTSHDSSIFCVSNLPGFGEIMFELKIDNKKKDKIVARLYLLETVYKINGYLQNTIRTEIARLETKDEILIETAYDTFNIKVQYDEEEGRDYLIKDNELFNGFCMARKQFCLSMKELLGERIMDLYGKYFQTRMLLLKKIDNDFTNAVLNSYEEEVKKIQKYFYKYATNKNRNELLDKCFEDLSHLEKFKTQEEEYMQAQDSVTKQFTADVSELETECELKAVQELKKNDKEKINSMREAPVSEEVKVIKSDENEKQETKQSETTMER